MATDDPCTPYEERAAILEYDAGMSRADAERMARIQLREGEFEQREMFGGSRNA